MSKNNKEKSFWKKLGLGKNKTSTSSLRSEQVNDKGSVKSKRLSGMFLQQQLNDEVPRPPPIPTNSIKKQTRVNLPENHIQSPNYNNSQHVDSSTKQVDVPAAAVVQVEESIVTPTTKEIQQSVATDEQPIINVTPIAADDIEDDFIVVNKKKSTDIKNEEFLSIITKLKVELENEKATVDVLQKQKEAVTKDLDYLELTVDELLGEKTDLLQQLEDEKIKCQGFLDDLDLSLEKQRSNADNARDQSFAVDQTKLEFESFQEQCRLEQQELLSDISLKDKTIRELKSKLSKSQEQVETLKSAMEQLVKSHTEELSRIALEQTEKSNNWHLHTPNGSPLIKPREEEEGDNDWKHYPISSSSSPIIPVPSSSTTPFSKDPHHYGSPQSMTRLDSAENHRSRRAQKESIDLDNQLTKLLNEKEKLQSLYSKIPISGGGPQSRRRKEELEAMLDQVDSQLSKVKQKIRRS